MSTNGFKGDIPSSLGDLTSLQILDLSNNRLSGKIPVHLAKASTIFRSGIGNLSQLQTLLLKNNSFEGNIPNQICHLSSLTVIDLSWNNFFGDIPHCLHTADTKTTSIPTIYFWDLEVTSLFDAFKLKIKIGNFENQIEFTTKGITLFYKGVPLDLFSAIDLSNNKLTGCIPPGIGNFRHIKSLNLSHNNLIGPIPATFSNLENIESLDLSYNSLQGNIPYELTGLHFLESFNVSYNNLSGRIPQGPNQFQTFDGSSYIGNPLLCREEVPNSCNSPMPTASPNNSSEVEFSFIEMGTFYTSFAGSYLTMLLVIAGILYINPHWRQVWFHFVDVFITSCYYFVTFGRSKPGSYISDHPSKEGSVCYVTRF
ncbi:receptor-like protein 13 [Diospyros lotus]|uniref:receptor-like protein 13 n=1 Tax=Diospyros lotus TaxID=55363 RepID=UPI00224DAE27|nr:receptor-like protein 13 [Diospyros lotus]